MKTPFPLFDSVDGLYEKHSSKQASLFVFALGSLVGSKAYQALPTNEDREWALQRAAAYYKENPGYSGESFRLINGVFFIEMENGRLVRYDS